MASRSVILLPPSEGKALGGEGPPWQAATMRLAELDPGRTKVLRALGRRHPARTEPTLPAIERYTGVLYKELDAASLTSVAKRRLEREVLIASGLWGLVAPSDPIPHYKLKMSANIAPLGRLSTFWKPQVTDVLAPVVAKRIVWDLLPIEHRAAVDWGRLAPAERRTVRFVDRRGATVSHWNKLLKGALLRWLATHGTGAVHDLAAFDHPQGYVFDPSATEIDGLSTHLTFRSS